VLRSVVPEYPAIAKLREAEGTVVLNANVDERGRVIRVWVAQATATEALIQAAVDAMYRFQFSPGSQQGVPVKCTVAVPFNFRLNLHL
jgi:protein TonB